MKKFIERYQAAWESTDPLAMKTVWHDEGILHHPILSEAIPGTLIPALTHLIKSGIPGFKWSLLRWAHSGEYLFIEWENVGDLGDERKTWRGVDRMRMKGDPPMVDVRELDRFRVDA